MTSPVIQLQLDAADRHYAPGGTLTGRSFVDDPQQRTPRAAELSVLWYTAGKGAEDLAVLFIERMIPDGEGRLDLRTPRRFSVKLPLSPLSYGGALIKVCWCVRLRLFLPRGQEAVGEVPFRLGSVAPYESLSDPAS